MVDFATETVIDVRGVTEKFHVTHDTVYRWFKRGLDHVKVGGKVVTTLQALNRFVYGAGGVQPVVAAAPLFIDRETADAIRDIRDRFGRNKGVKDGGANKEKVASESQVPDYRV
jgi:hypothetical protein